MKMPFGKYEGEDVEDVPLDYLIWFAGNIENANYQLMEEVDNQILLKEGKGVVRE